MDVNDIINSAFNDNKSVRREGLFVLEGDPGRNMFRIVPAAKALKDNMYCFINNINSGFQFMGIYETEKAAKLHIDIIRQKLRDEHGNRLI